MPKAYYNEINGFCCDWLQNLMDAGHIMPGNIDDRSIEDVSPEDLYGYERCHFFAGIAGWELALQWAGWQGPVWTGSCPCQPLSSAGQRKGHADKRHLWPTFQSLIAECRPATVFGEQVASKDGREWFAAVRSDLERMGYACGGADLAAAGVGAPHIRQRLFWVAKPNCAKQGWRMESQPLNGTQKDRTGPASRIRRPSVLGRLAHTPSEQVGRAGQPRECAVDGVDYPAGSRRSRESESQEIAASWDETRMQESQRRGWLDARYIPCADGKARPVEPGIQPLAHGIPGRVGRLRAYGNAIVPQVAAEFVQAFMEARAGNQ